MKAGRFTLAMVLGVLLWSYPTRSTNNPQSVNAVLGDVSFVEKLGRPPDASTDADLRIRTHLEYVERRLREKDCSGMTKELRQS